MHASARTESSSTEISLRYHAPCCVAQAWKAANAYPAEPAERLASRFAFVEVALRYIVAVLSAEYAAKGLSGAPTWEATREELAGKGVPHGTWHAMARELSIATLSAPDPMLEPIASVLARRDQGRVTQSAANAHVESLIAARNVRAHGDPTPGAQAPATLADTEDAYRQFAGALRNLGKLAIWVALRCSRTGDEFRVELLCLRGLEPPPARRVVLAEALEDGRPFVVSPAGHLLYLDPLLRWGQFAAGGKLARPHELRLFKQWKSGKATFSDPHGFDEALPLAGSERETSAQLLARHAPSSLRRGCFRELDPELPTLLDPDRTDEVPEIPGYSLGARLGQGGNGRVYAARDLETQAPVAVKVLSPGLLSDPLARDRLRREFAAMTQLGHRNIARVYRFLPDLPHGPTLVMEHVFGENLRVAVSRRPMPLNGAIGVIEQVLAGLAEAHALGIVHRDVTPENVIVGPAGEAKLIDFGIAILEGDDRITRTMDGLGKLNFAAPEQVERPREVGRAADVFAVGRLLGFLVSGSTQEGDQLGVLPGALQAIVRIATRTNPNERYPDAAALLGAIRTARQGGWEGSPVAAGDQLSPDCVVEEVLRAAGEGLWFIRIRDTKQQLRCVGVAAERRQEPEDALAAHLQRLSAPDREALGQPDTRMAPGGIHWCRLRVAEVAEIGGPFGTPPRRRAEATPAAPAPTSAVAPAPARPTSAPPPVRAPARAAPPVATRTPNPASVSRAAPPPPRPAAPSLQPMRSGGDHAVGDWHPPRPEETGEPELDQGALPGGLLGVLFLCFPLLWPVLILRVAQERTALRIPPPPNERMPSYLPPLSAIRRGTDPAAIARRLDDLAMIIIAQRHARGVQPTSTDTQRYLRNTPTRPSWLVLTLPRGAELDAHTRAAAGRRAKLHALRSLRGLHEALASGTGAVRDGTARRLNGVQTILHRLAHAGARDIPDAEVVALLRRG